MDIHKHAERFGKDQIISGIWKFNDNISPESLGEVAEKWAKENPKYMELFIRKVSKNQYGICFMYDTTDAEDSEEAYDKYFDSTTDKLKRQFGNDLAGWDISSSTTIIKR